MKSADLKLLLIIYLKKIWVLIVGTILGGIVALGLYFLCHVVLADAASFEATSKYYLTFAKDEDGDAYQYYNGYTWNDLIKCEPIFDSIMAKLPGEDAEFVKEAITADIISDIRLLTTVVTTGSLDRTNNIVGALEATLIEFGDEQIEFDTIEVIDHGTGELVILKDETVRAVVIGLFLGFVCSVFVLALVIVSENAVYTPTDVRECYPLVCVGVKDNNGQLIGGSANEVWDCNRKRIEDSNGDILTIQYKMKKSVLAELVNDATKDYKAFEIVDADSSVYRMYYGK